MSALSKWILAGSMVTAMATAGSAAATTISFDLAGDMADKQTQTYKLTYWQTDQTLSLKDTATSTDTVPAFILGVGDTVQVNVTLNNPWTLNDSVLGAFLELGLSSTTQSVVVNYGSPALSFYLNGAPVAVPAGFGVPSTSSPLFFFMQAPNTVATQGFTFDSFTVNASILSLNQSFGGGPLTSLQMSPFSAFMTTRSVSETEPVGPVPLPAAGWLVLSALGGLAAMRRRRGA